MEAVTPFSWNVFVGDMLRVTAQTSMWSSLEFASGIHPRSEWLKLIKSGSLLLVVDVSLRREKMRVLEVETGTLGWIVSDSTYSKFFELVAACR